MQQKEILLLRILLVFCKFPFYPQLVLKIIVYGFFVVNLLFALFMIWQIYEYFQIRKGNFRVIVAPLIKTIEIDYNLFDKSIRSFLEFGKQGSFTLTSIPLYQSSPYYRTTRWELMERSCNGDEFYLIKRYKNHIHMVYPTRCFLWDGETHPK